MTPKLIELNPLTAEQHVDNLLALHNTGGYVSDVLERFTQYFKFIKRLPADTSVYDFDALNQESRRRTLNEIIPHKLELLDTGLNLDADPEL